MAKTAFRKEIFSIPAPLKSKGAARWFSFLVGRPMESLLGLRQCRQIYTEISGTSDPEAFPRNVLDYFGATCEIEAGDMNRIPASGATIVIANHPFGGVEGLMLMDILKKIRPDVKIMANFLLQRIPELADIVIPVDPFGTREAGRRNLVSLKESIKWVQNGGLLVIFPAGEVSHLQLKKREIADPAWSTTVARIIRKTEAQVLPLFFSGHNGWMFQTAGLLHPRMRTLLLVRALLSRRNTSIQLRIGNIIPWKKLKTFINDQDMTAYLRLRTYVLGCLGSPSDKPFSAKTGNSTGTHRTYETVADAQFTELLGDEIHRLPKEQLLLESGEMEVWEASAAQIPYTLLEIARLREVTFREVGEGCGKKLDLDRFDRYYTHIFVWNRNAQEIVGAYRLGKSDEILDCHGRNGLYTHTLFRYRKKLFQKIGPALELGRSFVRPEYQKNFSSLLLLWKGIGHYVVKHPQYRVLFGPVSISRNYSDLSRQLIAGSMQATLLLPEWSRMVKPRMPLTIKPLKVKGCSQDVAQTFVHNMEEVSSMVAHIDMEQKGIPILLKHYLNLGGKLLAFNFDPDFSNVLDGLILVDLTRTEKKTLERYMGKAGMNAFLNYHQLMSPSEARCA